MKALMLALMTWASAQTGLPVPERVPAIQVKSPCELHAIMQRPEPCDKAVLRVGAIYMPNLIVLPAAHDPRDLYAVSVLLHELVHHMQFENGDNGRSCPERAAREKVAYDAQIAFLEATGHEAMKLMGIDGLTLLLLTNCLEY